MALVPQVVTNIQTFPIVIRDFLTFDNLVITLEAGATVDLFTTAADEDIARSSHLRRLVALGVLSVVTYFNTDSTQADETTALKAWIVSGDALIQFFNVNGPSSNNTYSGPQAGTAVMIGVTNGLGILDPFNNTATVQITVTGGTATSPKINGSSSPLLVTMVDGLVGVSISATSAGTVTLGLANGNTTLDRTDTATVTLS